MAPPPITEDHIKHRVLNTHKETFAFLVPIDEDVKTFLNSKIDVDMERNDILEMQVLPMIPDPTQTNALIFDIRLKWDRSCKSNASTFRVLKDNAKECERFFTKLQVQKPVETKYHEFFLGLQLFGNLRHEIFKCMGNNDSMGHMAKSGDCNSVVLMFRPNVKCLDDGRKRRMGFLSLLPDQLHKEIDFDRWIYKPLQFCPSHEILTRKSHPAYLDSDDEDDFCQNMQHLMEDGIIDIMEEGEMDMDVAREFCAKADHKIWCAKGAAHCQVFTVYNHVDRVQGTSFDVKESDDSTP
jgi:hypothetical protein